MTTHAIRFRTAQMLLWGVIVAACGAALVAGLYFNVLEVPWHLSLGHLHTPVYSLKEWWDGGMHIVKSHNWYLYRHGIRDLGEPALATIAVKTLLAKRKTWDKRCGPFGLTSRLLLVVAATIGLAIGAVWLINFGIPKIYLAPPWMIRFSLEQIILGILIGQVVHKIWAPAGATIQGRFIDRAVERSDATGRVPLWIRYPLSPVQIRERFTVMRSEDTRSASKSSKLMRASLVVSAILVAYLVVTGFIAHYWIGAGHAFPYFAS